MKNTISITKLEHNEIIQIAGGDKLLYAAAGYESGYNDGYTAGYKACSNCITNCGLHNTTCIDNCINPTPKKNKENTNDKNFVDYIVYSIIGVMFFGSVLFVAYVTCPPVRRIVPC